jgi:hypothetical protein
LDESGINTDKIKIVKHVEEVIDDEKTYFIVSERKYTKKRTVEEIEFMKFLLPEKAKFIPL